jgi:tetratricopeptide (TPR) repeat protein
VGNDLELALDRAELFQGQGKREEALKALDRAELLAGEAPREPARDERLAALKERLAAEARDQDFLASFEKIRLQVESQVDAEMGSFVDRAAVPAIRDALRQYGIAVGDMTPARAAALVQGRPGRAREGLIAALNECFALTPKQDAPARQWLLDTLVAADRDDWRVRVRQAAAVPDEQALEQLAGEADVRQQPPSFLLLVAHNFAPQKRAARLELLRRTQRAYPADLWANHTLAVELAKAGQAAEAVRYFTAALALRPDNPGIYLNRGIALLDAGEVDAAIADYRQCLALAPQYVVAHLCLGSALRARGRLDDAVAEFHEALRLNKDFAPAHSNLGVALMGKGRPEDALAEFQEALRIDKDYAPAHYNLGEALHKRGRLDDALAEFQEAIRLKKDYALAHAGLGTVLARKGRLDEAIAALQEAVRLKKDFAVAHYNLGKALFGKGRTDEAIAEYRAALRLKADYPDAHLNLGSAFGAKGRHDEAIAEFREAIRYQEDYALAHCNLGLALRHQGELRQSLEELRRGHQLGSRGPRWRYPSAQWVRQAERLVELDGRLPGFLTGTSTPAGPGEQVELAGLCTLKRLHGAAARFYADAFAAEPKLAERLGPHRYNAACAAALAGCGRGKDADRLDDKERARLRRQALEWLRADLAAWGRLLDKGPDQTRGAARLIKVLRSWPADADFAGVRGPKALVKLPESERRAWQQLWDDVAALLARAKATPLKKSDAN